jgi:hypothetical protein
MIDETHLEDDQYGMRRVCDTVEDIEDDMDSEPITRTCNLDGEECESCQ